MADKKINYAYSDYVLFRTTFSCTNEDVEEEFFQYCMTMQQTPRPDCEPMGKKALCEQCEHFGKKDERINRATGEARPMRNHIGKDLAE